MPGSTSGRAVRRYETTTMAEVHGERAAGAETGVLLDVRQPNEWATGVVPDSETIFVADLPAELEALRNAEPVTVFCRTGHRASIAASILENAGRDVRLVSKGGASSLAGAARPARDVCVVLVPRGDALRRLYDRAIAGPDYPPNEADLRDIELFGLALPRRASVAVLAMTALDRRGPAAVRSSRRGRRRRGRGRPPAGRARPGSCSSSSCPLAIVLLGFRDDPRRYGLRLGDWRWGPACCWPGCVVMTPIILGLAGLPSRSAAYYGDDDGAPRLALANNLVELLPAEFLLRGFLMFALWRRIGPLALIVQLVPFVLTHIGKPEIELWSTFIGGSIFAWLDWRTGSILWSALGHVFVLTLMLVAVGGATLG